jgi:hypothetical protein
MFRFLQYGVVSVEAADWIFLEGKFSILKTDAGDSSKSSHLT